MFFALSQAWQSWKSARAVAFLATLAFAVGIGSATAIFTVVNAVALKPLPYPEGHRFAALYGATPGELNRRSALSFRDLLEYQQRTHSFDVFGWFRPRSFNMTFAGQAPEHLVGVAVTPSLAHNLGVNPIVGQWFSSEDGVVIANVLWRRLGSDPQIVGKPLSLDGRTYTITGVMPPGFRLPVPGPGVDHVRSEVWIALDPLGKGMNPSEGAYFGYVRLKPGVAFVQAQEDVKRVAAEIVAADPGGHPSYTAQLDALRDAVLFEIKPTLVLLAIAAGLLLLITCADVAGLMLARSITRARETAVRVALGAARQQLALQYFAEGLLVSLAGAAAGVAVSVLLIRVVLSIGAEFIPRADEISIDWTVLLFAVGAGFLASAIASLAPLWQAVRTVPADVLNHGVRATAGARSRRLSHGLVVLEIALAFTLLSVSAVLIGHLVTLGRVSPGFDANDLVTFRLTVPERAGASSGSTIEHQKRLTAAVESIPGVTSAGFANQLPLAGCCFSTTVYPEGRPPNLESVERTSFLVVSPGYFRAMQLPLLNGRFLDERDTIEDPLQVVVNESAVRVNWPDRNPIGAFGRAGSPTGSRFQIVGVVGDVRNDGLGKPTVPEIYLLSSVIPVNPMRFVVRSALPASTLVPAIRRAIQTVDSTQPIHDVSTMRDIVRESVSLERVGSYMVGFFAVAALIMASLGIYGVVSYGVRQSTTEIGTRMALGAIGRDILLMVIGGGMRMAAYGAVLGGVAVVFAAWALVRAFGIADLGVIPFATSTIIVGSVTTLASFFPAWQATQLSPMVAIRDEPRSSWEVARESLRKTLKGISRVAFGEDEAPALPGDLLSDLALAARGASSYAEAFQRALATLSERLGAAWAMLFEDVGGELRPVAAHPLSHGDGRTLPTHGFLTNRLTYYTYPFPFTRGDLDAWRAWAAASNVEYVSELDTLIALDPGIAVALRAKGDTMGLLLLGHPRERGSYGDAERQLLRQCGEQLTLMIENARLTSRVVEQEKLRRDVALAAEVQRRLLPEGPPARAGAALAAQSLPARSVGGDYYDFIDLGDQRIGIALADIAGKGVAAALLMAVVQASLRIVAAEGGTSLPELAAKINGFLHRSTGSNGYATFFYAQLDEPTRTLRYVNAGHNPPYLLRAAGSASEADTNAGIEIRELSVGGTVLGLFPQMSYDEATVQLQPGDVVVAFTDGVTEALNTAEEEFGEERLKNLLRDVVHLTAPEISARIGETLRGWIKDTTQYDDLTFVVMKVN